MIEYTNFVGRSMIKKYNTDFSMLLKLILDMSEEQQSILLRQAQRLIDKREKYRTPCFIPAQYNVFDEPYSSFYFR